MLFGMFDECDEIKNVKHRCPIRGSDGEHRLYAIDEGRTFEASIR